MSLIQIQKKKTRDVIQVRHIQKTTPNEYRVGQKWDFKDSLVPNNGGFKDKVFGLYLVNIRISGRFFSMRIIGKVI